MEITLQKPRTDEISRVTSGREKVSARLVRFLSESGFAVNLAIFRMVVFAVPLLSPDFRQSLEYSALPAQLMSPPAALGPLIASLPINPNIVSVAQGLLVLLSVCAIIGFQTRKCALGAALLEIYVLGIPQLFGFVKHETLALVWFAFVLAFSDCARVLSVDALIKGWREASCEQLNSDRPSMRCGVPLHLIWLLLGILYLFPGFWKVYLNGLTWALSDNLRWTILDQAVASHHLPTIKIYDSPWLYQMAGLGTLAFELGFIVLVFTPAGRTVLALFGQLFHTGIMLTIGISFSELQACYVCLINWRTGLRWLGEKLFPEQLLVEYATDALAARRFLSMLGSVDLLARLEMRGSNDPASVLKATVGAKSCSGEQAALLIMRRFPFMWLVKPFWPLIANAVAKKSFSEPSIIRPTPLTLKADPKEPSLVPVIVVGLIFLSGNVWYGCHMVKQAWPVACYPCFSGLGTPQTKAITVSAWGPEGERIGLGSAMDVFSRGRITGFWRSVFNSPAAQREEKLKVLLSYLVKRNPELARASVVSFDCETLEAAPELWVQNPVAVDTIRRIAIRR